jgi:hypothetical protein
MSGGKIRCDPTTDKTKPEISKKSFPKYIKGHIDAYEECYNKVVFVRHG